jgi:hypothetical protein
VHPEQARTATRGRVSGACGGLRERGPIATVLTGMFQCCSLLDTVQGTSAGRYQLEHVLCAACDTALMLTCLLAQQDIPLRTFVGCLGALRLAQGSELPSGECRVCLGLLIQVFGHHARKLVTQVLSDVAIQATGQEVSGQECLGVCFWHAYSSPGHEVQWIMK